MSNKSKKSTIKLFRTFGNGPVKIVCLHGIFGPDVFDKFFDSLEETTYSVFVFSMFGYFDDIDPYDTDEEEEEKKKFVPDEESLEHLNTCTLEMIAKDLFIEIDLELKFEKFHILTHNFGAALGMKISALRPSRVMTFSLINPCGILPSSKETHLTRKRMVKKVVENKNDDNDEIYDDNGNLIKKEIIYEDVEVSSDLLLFPEQKNVRENFVTTFNLHVLWDNYMKKLINIVEENCPPLYIAKRRLAHDKFVTNHYLNIWNNSNLVDVAKDLPIRTQIIIAKDDPLSTKEKAETLLDLFAKKKSVLGIYEPKCSKLVILKNSTCGHLSLLTNEDEIKTIIVNYLPKM